MFSLSRKSDVEDDKANNLEAATKESKSTQKHIEEQVKHQRNLIEKDTLIPRLVANGTQLVHTWEDQYYVVNEYRANAHQV